MFDKLVMSPGPTEMSSEVRNAMAVSLTNPGLDEDYFNFHEALMGKFQKLLNTKNDIVIMCGEAILGLEAACATLTETDDRVLVLHNGHFGLGFGAFPEIYGGHSVYLGFDHEKGIEIKKLEDFLQKDSNFKYATMVHCETPSGITNNVKEMSKLLKKYGIMTVVDAVSSIGGEEIEVDEWDIDILITGSQKCLSAIPGLTVVSVSKTVYDIIDNRKERIKSNYANLNVYREYRKIGKFPYTMPANNIYSLDVAIDQLFARDYLKEHERIATAFRKTISEGGLELYAKDSFSNTVTAIKVPSGVEYKDLFNTMKDKYKIIIAGSFGNLYGKVFRIGHMGFICNEELLAITLEALQKCLKDLGFRTKCNLKEKFLGLL